MLNAQTQVRPALKLQTQDPSLIIQATSIVGAMINNPAFQNAVPKLADVNTHIAAYAQAQADIQTTKGAAAERNARRKIVKADLRALRLYVEQVVSTVSPEEATALIHSVLMATYKTGSHSRPDLAVKQGLASGIARVIARSAGRKVMYLWQWSADGITWTEVPTTQVANATIVGLTPMVTYHFRYRTRSAKGDTDWHPTVTLFIK